MVPNCKCTGWSALLIPIHLKQIVLILIMAMAISREISNSFGKNSIARNVKFAYPSKVKSAMNKEPVL